MFETKPKYMSGQNKSCYLLRPPAKPTGIRVRRVGQGRAGQGRATQGRAGQGKVNFHLLFDFDAKP